MFDVYQRFLTPILCSFISVLFIACGTTKPVQPIEPDLTSYPKDRIKVVMKRATLLETMGAGSMALMNGALQHEFQSKGETSLQWEETEYGDSATSSVDLPSRPPMFVVGLPGAVFGAGFTVGDQHLTKQQILTLIDQTGRDKCGDDYRALSSRTDVGGYYVRCPIKAAWNDSPLIKLINDKSKEIGLLDYNYFDVHEKEFSVDIREFWIALKESLSERGWFGGAQIGIEEQIAGQHIIITKRHTVGTFLASHVTEQLVLAAAPTATGGTSLKFLLEVSATD